MRLKDRLKAVAALEPGKTYVYEYEVFVIPQGPRALTKGRIPVEFPGRVSGEDEVRFHFLAFNDDCALAHLRRAYRPEDGRRLRGGLSLHERRLGAWQLDSPLLHRLKLLVEPGGLPPEHVRL